MVGGEGGVCVCGGVCVWWVGKVECVCVCVVECECVCVVGGEGGVCVCVLINEHLYIW